MKYVMFRNKVSYIPIIFPDTVPHICVAEAFKEHPDLCKLELISAGFIELECGTTYGESETLQIKSRELDAKIIDLYSITHGIIGLHPDDPEEIKDGST
jgi:hypothetical protein